MGYCANCGFELGIGRFCTNCGQPIAGRHERASTTPSSPPPAAPTAPPQRFPLYADSVSGPRPTGPPAAPAAAATVAVPQTPLPPPPSAHQGDDGGRGNGWIVWAAAAVVLALVLVLGLVLLLGDDDETAADARSTGTAEQRSAEDGDPTEPVAPSEPTETTTAAPPTEVGPVGDATALLRKVDVPGTAPASTDARTGEPVTFESANLVDGDTTTCWRVPGDASGSSVTLTFAEPVQVTELGLVNGYAKSYPGYDGYRLNRRVLVVDWTFDDGSAVTQQLGNDRLLQPVTVEPTWTEQIRIEIVEVSPPASGPLGKDFTPISEVAVRGATAE